ncbi:MAG: S8 family serine peptidase [Coriobacteriia bacterium]|nr:S8 family serine peptidase [Coriobacteriia bacterium]
MKTLRLIIVLTVTLALAMSGVAFAAVGETPAPGGRAAGIIVKAKSGSDAAVRLLSDGIAGGSRIGPSELYRVHAGGDPASTLATLRANPAVEWAEPDYVRELLVDYTGTPDDPHFTDPTAMVSGEVSLDHVRSWYLRGLGSISADTVWPYLMPSPAQQYGARASASAFPVAVIDTGFYMDHPDRGANVVAGKDFLSTYTYATDVITTDDDITPVTPGPLVTEGSAAHGTCVAGEIAAATNNGVGTAGVGYDTAVYVYKVQGICVDGIPGDDDIAPGTPVILDSAVIAAIHQATDDGCKVISMSLGGPSPSNALQDAIDYAHAHGVLVVAASGNYAGQSVQYPAACDHVVAVGSYRVISNTTTIQVLQRSSFTSYGTGLDLLAPGESVWGLTRPGYDEDGTSQIAKPGYTFWQGTSMAAPLVAGGAAALWRLAPGLSSTQLAEVLFGSAQDMGACGYDTETGWGAFNMDAARSTLVSTYPELLAPVLLTGPASAIATSTATLTWQSVAGQGVTYRASLDGSGQDLAVRSVSYASLSEGWHTVTITAMSPLNWWDPVRSTTIVEFLVDITAPATPTVSTSNGTLVWTSTEPELKENRLRIDSGTEVVLPGATSTYSIFGLTAGSHFAEVKCIDRAGNESGWGRVEFVVDDPPEIPGIGSSYSTADGSFFIDWPDAERATSYRYVFDGAAPVEITDSAITLSDLGVGRYSFWVRAISASGMSSWATARLLVESSPVQSELTVTRVEGTAETGTDRIGTAIAASRLAFPQDGSPYVLIATAQKWPDALGGSALAGSLEAPVLLVRQDELPAPVIAEISRLGARHVIVLGGANAVSDTVFTRLAQIPGVEEVERIEGGTRYETAAAIANRTIEEMDSSWDHQGVVATGGAFPDALGGAPLCVANGWPVYLVHPDPAQQAELASRMQADGVQSAVIFGGPTAVPVSVETGLEAALGEGHVRRLGGSTRYDTAVQVARYGVDEAGLSWDDLAIVRGDEFPDALAGGVLQGHSGSVLLLTRPISLPGVSAAELQLHADVIHEVRFLGGAGALGQEVRSSVISILAK